MAKTAGGLGVQEHDLGLDLQAEGAETEARSVICISIAVRARRRKLPGAGLGQSEWVQALVGAA